MNVNLSKYLWAQTVNKYLITWLKYHYNNYVYEQFSFCWGHRVASWPSPLGWLAGCSEEQAIAFVHLANSAGGWRKARVSLWSFSSSRPGQVTAPLTSSNNLLPHFSPNQDRDQHLGLKLLYLPININTN